MTHLTVPYIVLQAGKDTIIHVQIVTIPFILLCNYIWGWYFNSFIPKDLTISLVWTYDAFENNSGINPTNAETTFIQST